MVETDFIIASINVRDPLHPHCTRILRKTSDLLLSPYSIIELDALVRSGNIRLKNYTRFFEDLDSFLSYHDINILSDKAKYHAKAEKLRGKHGLTYFDSLHAAAALVEGLTLISSDPVYKRVERLEHVHIRKLTQT